MNVRKGPFDSVTARRTLTASTSFAGGGGHRIIAAKLQIGAQPAGLLAGAAVAVRGSNGGVAIALVQHVEPVIDGAREHRFDVIEPAVTSGAEGATSTST